MAYVHKCLIVPAQYQEISKLVCFGLAGESAKDMFITGLSENGNKPATHYISVGCVEDTFVAAMLSVELLYQICSNCRLDVTFDQCKELLSNSSITSESVYEVLKRLNLKKVSDE